VSKDFAQRLSICQGMEVGIYQAMTNDLFKTDLEGK